MPPPPLVYRDRENRLDPDVLDDTVDGDWCTYEWFYDVHALDAEMAGTYRESSFAAHPLAPGYAADTDAAASPRLHIAASPENLGVPPPAGATVFTPRDLSVRRRPLNAPDGGSF